MSRGEVESTRGARKGKGEGKVQRVAGGGRHIPPGGADRVCFMFLCCLLFLLRRCLASSSSAWIDWRFISSSRTQVAGLWPPRSGYQLCASVRWQKVLNGMKC